MKCKYLLTWKDSQTGQVKRGRFGFASQDMAETVARRLNWLRPEVEYWVEKTRKKPLATSD